MNICKIKLALSMSKKGYNFTQLAEVSGISRATLSYINNGKSCKVDILIKLSKALEINAEDLLKV